ncbi:MAG: hypothetical protein TREMPRED_001256 [Tremellales sp. Tagirdzhanova-0007]|nr:MAG: hypothetical protein TREMPRED_001256 [Tremellales sp. Tagirdzhanova-0007]
MGKRHTDRVLVVGDDRHYRDTDEFYRYGSNEADFGHPIYFGQGEDFNRIRVVGGYPENVEYVRGGYTKRHDDCRDGRCDRGDEHRNECRDGRCDGDVTVINHKRQSPTDMGGAPGYIDVTSPVFNSTTAQRIASLVLSTSNGTDANSTFVLNASNNIRTQVYLVPVNSTTPSNTTEGPIEVNLKLPIFVAASATVEQYCATFDPSPDAPAPLTVMPCVDDDSAHESQKFLYNPDTGVIHPDWTPSTTSQELLQSVPDSVDDDSEQDFTSTMTASATAMAADSLQTGSDDWYTFPNTASMTAPFTAGITASPTASYVQVGAVPTSAPVAITTAGPSNSTNSTSISTSPSNVTLIFSPAGPSVTDSEAIYQPESDSDAAADGSQMNVKRQYQESDRQSRGDPERHGENAEQYPAHAPSTPGANDGPLDVPSNENAPVTASKGYASSMEDPMVNGSNSADDSNAAQYSQPNSMQAPMSAPKSYTAPYDWRWTAAADSAGDDDDASK